MTTHPGSADALRVDAMLDIYWSHAPKWRDCGDANIQRERMSRVIAALSADAALSQQGVMEKKVCVGQFCEHCEPGQGCQNLQAQLYRLELCLIQDGDTENARLIDWAKRAIASQPQEPIAGSGRDAETTKRKWPTYCRLGYGKVCDEKDDTVSCDCAAMFTEPAAPQAQVAGDLRDHLTSAFNAYLLRVKETDGAEFGAIDLAGVALSALASNSAEAEKEKK